MADLLTILTGVLTLIGACSTITKDADALIRKFKDAPDELLALSNEINDFHAVLSKIGHACLFNPQGNVSGLALIEHQPLTPLHDKVNQARKQLDDLGQFVTSVTKHGNGSHDRRVSRTDWVKKSRSLASKRERLRETRLQIHFLLAANTAHCSERVESALHGHSNECFRRLGDQNSKLDQIITSLAEASLSTSVRDSDTNGTSTEVLMESGAAPPGAANDGRDLIESFDSSTSHDQSLETFVSWPTDTVTRVRLQLRKCGPCEGFCSCICHAPLTWRMPSLLRCLVGNLLVGYSGLSLCKARCNIATCNGFHAQFVTICYCFPTWFLAKTVHVSLDTCFGGPSVGLFIQSRYPEFNENSIFLLANHGNTKGLKLLLDSKKASPNDADHARGHTPLHFAVMAAKVEVCQILLSAGANPNLEQNNGMSATQIAWATIFERPGDHRTQQLRSLFPETKCLDALDLSDLHKIVLAMLHLDLDEMLARPDWRAQVNHRDTWGRTPLHWAAMRGHAGHVLSLLAAEADVTAKDAWRETPLWKAVRSTDTECVRLLLVAKSRVSVMNIYNQEVIHHAAEKSLPVLNLLLDAGASPE